MPKPRPKRPEERLSDAEFFDMCGLEWPAEILEIDFSVPGTGPVADAYLPDMGPGEAAVPCMLVDPETISERPFSDFTRASYSPGQWRRACLVDTPANAEIPIREPDGTPNRDAILSAPTDLANLSIPAPKKEGAARKLVRLHHEIGEDPPANLLDLAGLTAGPSSDLAYDDVELTRIAFGTEDEPADFTPDDRKSVVDLLPGDIVLLGSRAFTVERTKRKGNRLLFWVEGRPKPYSYGAHQTVFVRGAAARAASQVANMSREDLQGTVDPDSYDFAANPIGVAELLDDADVLLPWLDDEVEPVDGVDGVDAVDGVDFARRRWKKHILPVGAVRHGNRIINFTKDVLHNIKENSLRAFDQVPANLATEDNRHNEDPTRFAGEVKDFAIDDKGLHAIIETNDLGTEVLQNNPRVGTSPRFISNYIQQATGKAFGAIVRHVCITQDPHIPGLGSWEDAPADVALSNYSLSGLSGLAGAGAGVVDLTRAGWIQFGERGEQGGSDPGSQEGGQREAQSTRVVSAAQTTTTTGSEQREVTDVTDPIETPGTETPGAEASPNPIEGIDFSSLTPEQVQALITGYQADLTAAQSQNQSFETRLSELQYANREKDVNAELRDFANRGIPANALRKAKGILMEDSATEEVLVVDFTAGENGQVTPQDRKVTRANVVREIFEDIIAAGGATEMNSERGTGAARTDLSRNGVPPAHQALRERHESDYQSILKRVEGVTQSQVAAEPEPVPDGALPTV